MEAQRKWSSRVVELRWWPIQGLGIEATDGRTTASTHFT